MVRGDSRWEERMEPTKLRGKGEERGKMMQAGMLWQKPRSVTGGDKGCSVCDVNAFTSPKTFRKVCGTHLPCGVGFASGGGTEGCDPAPDS